MEESPVPTSGAVLSDGLGPDPATEGSPGTDPSYLSQNVHLNPKPCTLQALAKVLPTALGLLTRPPRVFLHCQALYSNS